MLEISVSPIYTSVILQFIDLHSFIVDVGDSIRVERDMIRFYILHCFLAPTSTV